jgi:hypothetical protein
VKSQFAMRLAVRSLLQSLASTTAFQGTSNPEPVS